MIKNINKKIHAFIARRWLLASFLWAVFMFITMTVFHYFVLNNSIDAFYIIGGAVVWSIAGLLVGISNRDYYKNEYPY